MNKESFNTWVNEQKEKLYPIPKRGKKQSDEEEWDFIVGQRGTERIVFETTARAAYQLLSEQHISEMEKAVKKLDDVAEQIKEKDNRNIALEERLQWQINQSMEKDRENERLKAELIGLYETLSKIYQPDETIQIRLSQLKNNL